MTETPLIRPEIAADAVPMDAVTPYPGNARRGNLEKIKNSLRKHGQYKHLIADADSGHILVGNNTYAAMRELGYEQVAVKRLHVSAEQARELLLMDNASSDDAIYDDTALAALLAEVEDWDASGWVPDDLDDILVKLQQTGDPEALAAALPPAAAAVAPAVLPSVPATDARYSETPEDEAKRQEKFDTWTPRYARGLTEVILVYPEETRTEVLELMETIRKGTRSEARNGGVVLGALRLLAEAVDAHRRGDLMVDVAKALEIGAPVTDTGGPEAAAAASEAAQQEQVDVAADTAAAEADQGA